MLIKDCVHQTAAGGLSPWTFLSVAIRFRSPFAAVAGCLDICSYGIPGAIALVCTLTVLGDSFAYLFGIPIPGAAIGMMILVGLFAARGGPDQASAMVFDAATPYFPMFFVPAAVGVISSAEVVAAVWFQLVVAVVFGTAVTIVVTGIIAQVLLHKSFEDCEK